MSVRQRTCWVIPGPTNSRTSYLPFLSFVVPINWIRNVFIYGSMFYVSINTVGTRVTFNFGRWWFQLSCGILMTDNIQKISHQINTSERMYLFWGFSMGQCQGPTESTCTSCQGTAGAMRGASWPSFLCPVFDRSHMTQFAIKSLTAFPIFGLQKCCFTECSWSCPLCYYFPEKSGWWMSFFWKSRHTNAYSTSTSSAASKQVIIMMSTRMRDLLQIIKSND